jgi:hypothetical protein
MPSKATGPDCVTVLSTDSTKSRRHLLTKRITADGVSDYDRESVFEISAYRLDGPDDLPELLARLAGDPYSAIVRGVLKPEFAGRPLVLRRSRPRPGVPERFAPAARSWLMADCDGIPNPGVDATDPLEAGGALRRALPPAFWPARCVAQLSSTAGRDPAVVKAHAWFWCDRPLTDEQAKAILKGAAVDTSILHAVGLHYTAAPVVESGAEDPCVLGRLAVVPGFAMVRVPALPSPVMRQGLVGATIAASYLPPARGLTFRSTRAERYMLACLQCLAAAREGTRHNTCLAVACRLFELCRAGQLDPEATVVRLIRIALGTGLERDEIDSVLAWAWQQVSPKGLPYV